MKLIKRIASSILIMCLIFTSLNYQSINSLALESDNTVIIENQDKSYDNITLIEPDASRLDLDKEANLNINNDISTVSSNNEKLLESNIVTNNTEGTALFDENNEEFLNLNSAMINGSILTLNFNAEIDAESIPPSDYFDVKIVHDEGYNLNEGFDKDPVYTTVLDPVYSPELNVVIYPVALDNMQISDISIYKNKVVLTINEAVTSSSAIKLDYKPKGNKNLICDKNGNKVNSFSDYTVANITGESSLPNFVVERVYDELDTSLLTKDLSRQIYYAMLDFQGSKDELLDVANDIINILKIADISYSGLIDENKRKICDFFTITDEFFVYSEEKGESIEDAIIVHSKLVGYGLSELEIEQSIKDNSRDEIISEIEESELKQVNPTRTPRSTTSGDDFSDVKYDKENMLTAPFNHNAAANEQINLSSGSLNYNVTDAVLPGAGGLDLVIGRQYSTDQANYYDVIGQLKYQTSSDRKPKNSYMDIYEREKKYKKNEDETIGDYIEKTRYKLMKGGQGYFIDSNSLRGLYNLRELEDEGDGYSAHLYKKEMTTSPISMTGVQATNPAAENEKMWQLGTGWKFNFSYMELDRFHFDYMKLHLSDGREFCISPNWLNNLGHYTYKDVIFAEESTVVSGQTSSYSVTYADGKKEYFNGGGQPIAIVDRFGNTISFAYTNSNINNLTDITITDSIGRITTITNSSTELGYDKILKLPDGQTITYVVSRNKAMELDKLRQHERYSGEYNEYNLTKVINQENEVTTYNYTDIVCGSDFVARFKLSEKKKFMGVEAFDDGKRYFPNYYAGLEQVTYPTGLKVNYEYYTKYNAWYDYGCISDIAIKKRYDVQNGKEHNKKVYDYSYQFKKNGELRDALYNADGYSKDLPDKDPFEIWNDWYVKEKDIDRNTIKEYGFDYHRGFCIYEKTYLGDKLIESVSNNYRIYNLILHPSKTKVITDKYDTYDKVTLNNIECYNYDNKGNVIEYWPSLSEGDTLDTEYKVSMTYDGLYNQLTGKTYKRDSGTTIHESKSLAEDKKTIVQSTISENEKVKSKNDFAYDKYGNVIQSKKYTNLTDGNYIETDNTYKDGAYLAGITVQNIKNADGNNLGTISRFVTHDIYGRILTETDENGNITKYTYDKLGRITKIQYPDNSSKSYAYDALGNSTTITDERGFVTRYNYDQSGNLNAVYGIDGGTETLLKANEYDQLYRLTKESNNLLEGGSTANYSYDHKDRIIKKSFVDSTNKLLSQENYTYYDNKSIKTIEGAENSPEIVNTEYIDKHGRIIKKAKVVKGSEESNTFVYNYIGEVIQEKSARASAENYAEDYTTKYEYDYAGNIVKQYDVLGNCISTGYDATGRKISVTDAKSNASGGAYKTIYTYDALGRLLKEEIPFTETSIAVKKYYYDKNGNLVKKQIKNSLPGGNDTFTKVENVYNNKNQLIQIKSYDGDVLENQVDYDYDLTGNIVAMKTAGGKQVTKYEYDRYGKLICLTDPLGQQESYKYNINGNMISKTDKNGSTTTYTYDGLSRMLSQSVTEDGVVQSETFGYTPTGSVSFNQNENLRTDYTYDGQGRIIKETDSNGIQKLYSYDANGNLKNSNVQANGYVKKIMRFVYDKKDRLVQVYESDKLVATYTYDENGKRNSLTYGNGNSVDYIYNLANLVTSLKNKKGAEILSSYDYSYYLDGNKAKNTDHKGRQTSYTYDGLGRLTKEIESGASDAITKVYTFDEASNRDSMTVSGSENYNVGYSYDLNNRLTTETKEKNDSTEITDYYYDSNGNTIAKNMGILKASSGSEKPKVSIDMAGSELYSYDGFDRMTEVQNGNGSFEYTYRPDGLRISKSKNGVTTNYVWEGKNISLELDGNNVVLDKYVCGIGLINSDKNGWYLFNGHGDVVQLTDNTGSVVKEYVYDAFGNEKNIDSNDINPYRYGGEAYYLDKETSNYYIKARYYSPSIGRFISEDSFTGKVSDPLSLNLYTYCENNPIMYVDPSGHVITKADRDFRNTHNGNYGKKYGKPIATIVIGFTPLDVPKDVLDFVAGKDLLTGEDINRLILLGCIIGPEVTDQILKNGKVAVKVYKGGLKTTMNFADEAKLAGHFKKHGTEFKGAYSTAEEYLQGAREVIENGTKVSYKYGDEVRTGYVQFMGNTQKGVAKFEFVGTNNLGQITTYHVESGKDFWKMLNNGQNIPAITPIK